MADVQNRRILWPALIIAAATPRILGAFFLPNAFGDAYAYIRDIGTISTKISAGTFRLTDLFGFWLPFYQFLSALVNVIVRNGFYSGKLVSAVMGIGVCLFIYAITFEITANKNAALFAFLLIAVNPLHIVYSASAMTDVPHAFLVVAAIYFMLKQRWIWAAVFAALAGLTRMESWMFLALIPTVHFIRERRVSIPAVLILMLPPVLWLYISWKATGDAFACFKQRQEYLNWLLAANPLIAGFSLKQILKDTTTLLISTDVAVFVASFVGLWFLIKNFASLLRHRNLPDRMHVLLPPVAVFFAFLGLLLAAYVVHQQPIIFPRYGLILFTIGIPILCWTFLELRRQRPSWARRLLTIVALICALDAGIELVGAVGFVNATAKQRAVADYLRDHIDPKSSTRIFSDEGTVTVMSGLPAEMFLTSSDAPRDREGFINTLKSKNVEYLVFVEHEDSTPAKLFPELRDGRGNEIFKPVTHAGTSFVHIEIWVYQVNL
jgi:Dolichyl-phosphate-mannose-protein mannosyltransferase